ncbi:MAG: sterol desaturase family protein [Myxococcales bacterium]|nr:sterol desaturase family protein [Polyangiaceae bacterium]MDW8249355.1 sterol desaturase family protein [Myxococcales bacterium]
MMGLALGITACLLVPLLAALLASREVRAWLRGTGSIRQTLSNAGVGVTFLLSQALLRGTLLGAYAALAAFVPWKLPNRAWWSWLLAFLLLDCIYYVQHRLEHSIPLLWAIHAVHHQSRDYNLSVSFRVGALTSLSTLFFHSFLALAGVDLVMYAALVAVHGGLLFLLHARTRFTLGPGRFFNAPIFHRIHHGAEAIYIDKNFGGVFLVFDRIFGTFAPFTEEPTYGVVGQPSPANPLAANLAPFEALLVSIRTQQTLRDKLLALFRTPPAS